MESRRPIDAVMSGLRQRVRRNLCPSTFHGPTAWPSASNAPRYCGSTYHPIMLLLRVHFWAKYCSRVWLVKRPQKALCILILLGFIVLHSALSMFTLRYGSCAQLWELGWVQWYLMIPPRNAPLKAACSHLCGTRKGIKRSAIFLQAVKPTPAV
ncbi:hypothetical protein DFP72DRAFT_628806 [Ephemerocybe angulata]|uniref:Uncharacterized protein n=1 Tax=Ephemerocybe angulata TaxID=980116 RepID=A0A8H6MF46_9AGAR|nr:hypothetical protein DFP72DRAFT_628806 [Tulosesus angulatus]